MRIILDTDKKTITVPWNYQDKLNAMNAMIMEVTGDESKKKTFKGYINDIWNECMADSDKHVVTGKKPPKPDKKVLSLPGLLHCSATGITWLTTKPRPRTTTKKPVILRRVRTSGTRGKSW